MFELGEWTQELHSRGGVYLAHLVGEDERGRTVSHCVEIDATRDLFLNSCEAHPLRSPGEVIARGVGNGFMLSRVEEVRQLVKQHNSKGKKRENRRNPMEGEKKKEKKRMMREEMKENERKRVKRLILDDNEE